LQWATILNSRPKPLCAGLSEIADGNRFLSQRESNADLKARLWWENWAIFDASNLGALSSYGDRSWLGTGHFQSPTYKRAPNSLETFQIVVQSRLKEHITMLILDRLMNSLNYLFNLLFTELFRGPGLKDQDQR
jgi:hypothetical protein